MSPRPERETRGSRRLHRGRSRREKSTKFRTGKRRISGVYRPRGTKRRGPGRLGLSGIPGRPSVSGSPGEAGRGPAPINALRAFVVEAGRALGLRGTVSVRLMDDAAMRALNRRFLGHDWPTDVLSFPSAQPPHIGDLAVSVATARRQARQHGHPLAVELRILLLHGLLHLAGYDHEHDHGQMRRRERALRRQFGLPPGLIERAGRGRRKINS